MHVNIHDISIKLFIVVTCPFLVRLNPIVESTHNIFWLSVILSNMNNNYFVESRESHFIILSRGKTSGLGTLSKAGITPSE